jgi:hypothetical protein
MSKSFSGSQSGFQEMNNFEKLQDLKQKREKVKKDLIKMNIGK